MTKSMDLNPTFPSPLTPSAVDTAKSTNVTAENAIISANSAPTLTNPLSTSVELSCLSPDNQSFHTLYNKDTIVTQRLPLHQPDADLNDKKKAPFRTIKTKLPAHIMQTLRIDEPLELLCVDNHTPTSGNLLPLLCLYTSKSVFILQIEYQTDNEGDTLHTTTGTVVGLHEPFEQYLLSHDDAQIQRVRSAPQSSHHKLYSTICNRGAIAMLCTSTTSDIDNDYESSIVLFHGWSSKSNMIGKDDGSDLFVTVPVRIHSEQTDTSPIVDMAFLPSVARGSADDMLSDGVIWNSMSLLLTTENESLYVVSPIVFDNTIYPKRSVLNAIQEVRREIIRFDNLVSKSVECRRSKATLHYLKTIFDLEGLDENRSQDTLKELEKSGYYMKSNLKHGGHATTWPIAIQGPVFVSQSDDYEPIECLEIIPPSPKQLVGGTVGTSTITLVIGRKSSVDYVMIPSADTVADGSCLILPRFSFEDSEDREYLNAHVSDSGILVERVVFDDDKSGGDEKDVYDPVTNESRIALLIDPFMDQTMLHFVSSKGVLTITTNAISYLEKKLSTIIEGHGNENICASDKVRTVAFSSIDVVGTVGTSALLNGVTISGDCQFGHVMTVALSNGTMEAMNVSAAMYLSEANRQSSLSERSKTLYNDEASDDAIREIVMAKQALEPVTSVTDTIAPLYQQITTGLSNMSKIVGGSTQPKNVTPGMVATLLTSKQSSSEEVLLPLKEMNSIILARLPYLETMRKQQLTQIKQLKEIVHRVQERLVSTSEKRQIVEDNSKILASRVNAVLSTVRDLKPSLSKAEKEYFKDIDRQLTNCAKWNSSLQEIKAKYQDIKNKEFSITESSLNEEDKNYCNDLLIGEEHLLDSVSSRLHQMQVLVEETLSAKGFPLDSEAKRTPLMELTDC